MNATRNHYDNLQVAQTASPEVIKAAYRSLCSKYHPDRNPGSKDAARIMVIINRAYEVLSDPVLRQQHDDWIDSAQIAPPRPEPKPSPRPHPTDTQSPTPEPQMSQWDARHRQRPMFTPMPPIFLWLIAAAGVGTIAAVVDYFQPKEPSAEATMNVDEALTTESEVAMDSIDEQASPELLPGPAEPPIIDQLAKSLKPAAKPITMAPDGEAWPTSAGYLESYPSLRTGGNSWVTVDNSGNSSDVFVKLVAIDRGRPQPIRHIFIPKRGQFTMRSVPPGRYDVRYQDLADGGLARSDSFDLSEEKDSEGIRFDKMTLTLYEVANGNMETYPLDPSEF